LDTDRFRIKIKCWSS